MLAQNYFLSKQGHFGAASFWNQNDIKQTIGRVRVPGAIAKPPLNVCHGSGSRTENDVRVRTSAAVR